MDTSKQVTATSYVLGSTEAVPQKRMVAARSTVAKPLGLRQRGIPSR